MKKYSALLVGILIIGAFAFFDSKNSIEKINDTSYTPPTPQGTTTPSLSEAALLTKEEVATHNTADSCYAIIDNKVYNLTDWIKAHPGGERRILGLCGKDGTSAFTKKHGMNEKALETLPSFFIADIKS